MKYELDTIPVWDALKAQTECPFCLLERRSRAGAVRYYLGPSVMVPEVRLNVNKTGFSAENARLLAKDSNRLGLGLITHTRLKAVRESLVPLLRQPAEKKNVRKEVENLLVQLKKQSQNCLIQTKIDEDMNRFAFTFVHLFKNDQDFFSAWSQSKGLCLKHVQIVLAMAVELLSSQDLSQLAPEIWLKTLENLQRVENDLQAFTQTFDATHSHELAGNPEKALERAQLKLYGIFPEYEEESKTHRGPLMGM